MEDRRARALAGHERGAGSPAEEWRPAARPHAHSQKVVVYEHRTSSEGAAQAVGLSKKSSSSSTMPGGEGAITAWRRGSSAAIATGAAAAEAP